MDKSVRKTINLSPVLWDYAQARMRAEGFTNNFTQYVADLIRRDKQALEANLARQRLAEAWEAEQPPTTDAQPTPPVSYKPPRRRRRK